ncbi:MAG TPA: hypothetical protein VG011_09875, partial [Steroidobacteraceae bacterium]|nr:hypothetical protein [Steroidobacteraceae bacterium]
MASPAGKRRRTAAADTPPASRQLARPVFAQPEPTPDPTLFRVRHASDAPAYRRIDELNREHRIAP